MCVVLFFSLLYLQDLVGYEEIVVEWILLKLYDWPKYTEP